MPALPLTGSPPAIYAHVLFPLQPGVATSLQPEDFLIIRSCVDSCDYKKERKVNPSTGECYAVIYSDFEMSYRITADATAHHGLANHHPGKRVDVATMPACANAIDTFGVIGGILIYENPQRTRNPGVLPSISFTIAREGGIFVGDAALTPPAVAAVTTISYPPAGPPPSGARYDLIYNTIAVWIRVFNLTGPVTGLAYFTTQREYYTAPAGVATPPTLESFLAAPWVGPEVTGENEIEEVVTLGPAGITVLRAGDSLIPPLLTSGSSIPGANPFNFHFGGNYYPFLASPSSETGGLYLPNVPPGTTIAEFVELARDPSDAPGFIGEIEVLEVYDVARAVWLL